MIINAYAKLNLTLDIAGRREDGYHLLRMVMQAVSLCDVLNVEKQEGEISVSCGREDVPCGEGNTAFRAARVFFEKAGLPDAGARIRIEKRIPSQAGLGGGSADAAAVLLALNHLYEQSFTVEELCAMGVQVGADVPFCVRSMGGREAILLAEGIGEKHTPLPALPGCAFVICKPEVGVSTKEAFAAADRRGFAQSSFTEPMCRALEGGRLPEIAARLGNDFAEILQIPEVEHTRQCLLENGALGACMTGSGSAVFGIFEELEQARVCEGHLKSEYREVYACAPLRRDLVKTPICRR